MIAQSTHPLISSGNVKEEKRIKRKNKEGNRVEPVVHLDKSICVVNNIGHGSRTKKLSRSIDNIGNIGHLSKGLCTSTVQCDCSLKNEKAEWLTSKEAAEFLRISEGTLRNMTSNGRIPYTKLGRSNRYSREELRSLILSNKRGLYGN